MTNGAEKKLEQAIYELIQLIYENNLELCQLEQLLQQRWEEHQELPEYLVEQSLQARCNAILSFVEHYKHRLGAH